MNSPRSGIRFVCPGDPTRAFIAEAFARQQVRGSVEVSADGDPGDVHPAGRQVMAEVRLPLAAGPPSARRGGGPPELVIVIRDRGLPRLQAGVPSSELVSWWFDNPAAAASEAEALLLFRRVRDEIKRRVDLLVLVKGLWRRDRPASSDQDRSPRAAAL